jgi:ribosome-associated translation inhibitor RaiA
MDADEVQVMVLEGQVSDEVKERARMRIADLEEYAPRDFLFAEMWLRRPDSQTPSTYGHALVDVQGELVQAREQAEQPGECVDLICSRLERNLRRMNERRLSQRREPVEVEEGQWRRGALPTQRPDHFPRPVEEREVIERVTHAREPSDPEEAAFDAEMLDDDWLLYVDAATGTDAVIRRLPDGESYGVTVVGGAAAVDKEGPYTIHLEGVPPELTVADAIERLRAGDESHVFFVDTETGRGAVTYFRYDGHYGLVRPREGYEPPER